MNSYGSNFLKTKVLCWRQCFHKMACLHKKFKSLLLISICTQFMSGISAQIGAFACVATVKILGKRVLAMTSMISTSSLAVLLGIYILYQHEINQPWIFIMMYIAHGFTNAVVITIPWILMGEIYPFK